MFIDIHAHIKDYYCQAQQSGELLVVPICFSVRKVIQNSTLLGHELVQGYGRIASYMEIHKQYGILDWNALECNIGRV